MATDWSIRRRKEIQIICFQVILLVRPIVNSPSNTLDKVQISVGFILQLSLDLAVPCYRSMSPCRGTVSGQARPVNFDEALANLPQWY